MVENLPNTVRAWCSISAFPLADLQGRVRLCLREGEIDPPGPGRHASPASRKDGALVLLAAVCSRYSKDVVKAVRRYRQLLPHRIDASTTFKDDLGQENYDALVRSFANMNLLDVLAVLLERCGSWSDIRLMSMMVERSKRDPRAILKIGNPRGQFTISFKEPEAPHKDMPEEYFAESVRILEPALLAMADMLMPNIADLRTHENGPPAGTGEPDSLDDKPRGANPEAQDVLSKSSVCGSDVQPRSESRGRSSGGSSHPQTEISDDDYPDRRSDSVAASAA